MSSYNRRYAILQDKNLKSSEVESVKSVTTPPTVSGVNQSTKTEMYGESSLEPSVTKTSGDGDMSIVASGEVLPTYDEDTSNSNTYIYESGISPRKTSGSGLIQTDGASNRSRFSFIKDGQSNYQLRTTPNYFGKVPFTLSYDTYTNYSGKAECFTRPKLLSLSNGNLLCAYLDSYSPPWMWTYSSALLDPDLSSEYAQISVSAYNSTTNTVTVSTWSSEIQVNRYFTSNPTSSDPDYAIIISTDSASNTFVIQDKGLSVSTGAAYIYSVERFRNRPSNVSYSNVKLRLSLSKDKFWSNENATYPLSEFNDFGAVGLGLVEFKDTGEVLLLSCGYIGDADEFANNISYLNVDEIKSDFSSYSGFSDDLSSGDIVERRSSLTLNTYNGFMADDTTTDIANLKVEYNALAMTAEVLPSGRLVVVIAFSDRLVSLVSDDRGLSFSSTLILDLTFGSDYELQQFCSLDSVISKDGSMVILLTANSLGDRGQSSTEPAATDPISESVISIFTSSNGVDWSSEKRLGGGSYYLQWSQIEGGASNLYPANVSSHLDESIYALSGSICMTPSGGFLVSACTINLGGVGNNQGSHIYQRVLSVDEIPFGSTGLEIAPSLPAQIYSSAQPVQASISRMSMAVPYVGEARDDSYSLLESLSDYFDYTFRTIGESSPGAGDGPAPTYSALGDRGYLGSLYFAGIREVTAEALVHKRFGGGPIVVSGPIDVSTTLHNGEIVTVVCEGYESRTSDSPWAGIYLKSRNATKGTLERGINVLFSGGLQPLRVNIPTELRRFDASYDVAGRVNSYLYEDAPAGNYELLASVRDDWSGDGLTRNYVGQNHFHVLFDLSGMDFTGTPLRVAQFGIWRDSGGVDWFDWRFQINSVAYDSASFSWQINVTGLDGASTDDIFDGYPFRILAREKIIVGSSTSETGMVFGANCYQVSRLGAMRPDKWGWGMYGASTTQSYVEDSDSGVTYANRWEINSQAGGYGYNSFDQGIVSITPYGYYSFPNSDGDFLKSGYPSDVDALSFVQRTVVQIQYGGNRRSTDTATTGTTLDDGLRLSTQVFLRDKQRASGYFLCLGLGMYRDGPDVYFRIIETYWNGSETEYIPRGDELHFTDNGTGADVNEKVPFYEIIWGVEPHESSIDTYKIFMHVRPWNRYSDPDFTNDFSSIGPLNVVSRDTDYLGNSISSSTLSESIRYGTFSTTLNGAAVASFQAVQFARSFLKDEPCVATAYDNAGGPKQLPSGLFDFRESLHVEKEPAFDFLRFYNAGQMSPMSPPRCSSFPQLIDNGIELSFNGRVSNSTTFEYGGKSRFGALSLFDSPVKDGWRSPTEKLTFSVTSENTSNTFDNDKLPTYEITVSSQDGINPEAVSFFGLNSSSIRVDFSNSSTFGQYNSLSQPEITMLFCTPGDPSSLLFNYYNQEPSAIGQLNTPPSSPSYGDKYVVGPSPTGSWVGQSGMYALYTLSSWSFSSPQRGDIAKDPSLSTNWYLHVGSLSWIELVQPNIFYKPVYLQSFTKYSLLDPDVELSPVSVISISSSPPLAPSVGDKYLVSDPSGSWAASLANYIVEWTGSYWMDTAPFTGSLVYLESTQITLEYDGFKYISVNKPTWRIESSYPNTVYFTGSRNGSPPFRPSQYKSQSNESFYLVVVDRRATLNDDGTINVLFETKLAESADAEFTYYFKIVDNGSDYLTLDRSISDIFRDSISSASAASKITPGSMSIVSDRMASNMPDFYNQMGSGSNSRFRNMRITVCGGNHSEDYLKVGMMISGQRIDLSNPDFELGYSYNLESGSSIFDSLSGRRKSRRNHKPRKSWDVSYAPRPSAPIEIVGSGSGTRVMNTYAERGNVNSHVTNAAQNSARSKVSWQEIVERVLSIGIDGPVLALGFDGNNMQTVSGTQHNMTPDQSDIKPALTDPHGLSPVRLVGYEGAQNVAYLGQTVIANSQYGAGSDSGLPSEARNQTECVPAAVMQIKGLKFSEEL